MMSRFLEDRQRYDALACGVSTTSKETSPAQDIESMVKKLRVVMREAPVPTPRAGQKQLALRLWNLQWLIGLAVIADSEKEKQSRDSLGRSGGGLVVLGIPL